MWDIHKQSVFSKKSRHSDVWYWIKIYFLPMKFNTNFVELKFIFVHLSLFCLSGIDNDQSCNIFQRQKRNYDWQNIAINVYWSIENIFIKAHIHVKSLGSGIYLISFRLNSYSSINKARNVIKNILDTWVNKTMLCLHL